MNLNPFAKEFSPALPFPVQRIRTRKEEDAHSSASNNSLNHPNVGPGQCNFDLPECLKPASAVPRQVQLPSAPTSSSASASGADEERIIVDPLGELDEASLLEEHHALQAQPSLTVNMSALKVQSGSSVQEQQQTVASVSSPEFDPVGSALVHSPMYTTAANQRDFGSESGSSTPKQAAERSGAEAQECSTSVSEALGSSPVQDDGSSASTSQEKVGPESFELMRVVGQGAFGKVFQVRMKATGKVYAMKIMRKGKILEKDHGEYIKSERDVLTAVLHPYIVTLRYSFQTATKLYLVLDFINGGHLFFQLYRAGIFDEQLARLYTAEIVLAISHLHSLNTIHRDLKPENVLLDSEGHIKVTDFGLAKGNMDAQGRTNSFIGTMEYMAPEVIDGRGHGKAVDWWSMGILLFEMLCGMPPFRAKGRQQLQKQILSSKLKLPPYLSSEAQSLVKALLTREPSKRLGYGPSGSADVQKHPFFKVIKWDALMQRQATLLAS
ncbi:hypothetical protein WJX73_007625 [Symbiochloris irregularis]|uniref:non-specific serine/threonine protein kinase n=1 Tax=Symbiochloris irregularis TaxID=706552 RepID=A0AAW1PGL0_9CHLO